VPLAVPPLEPNALSLQIGAAGAHRKPYFHTAQ